MAPGPPRASQLVCSWLRSRARGRLPLRTVARLASPDLARRPTLKDAILDRERVLKLKSDPKVPVSRIVEEFRVRQQPSVLGARTTL